MKILIIGGGGREHALAWKITRDRSEADILVAPGWAGADRTSGVRAFSVPPTDVAGLRELALAERVDLTICGPEGPLAAGLVDAFTAAGLKAFGPAKGAAEIEASKAWSKAFMVRQGIPTARFGAFEDAAAAEAFIQSFPEPPVIKDDALAGGKGVTVASTHEAAVHAARAILARPGGRAVIEERLNGWELSVHAFCDGRDAALMPFACDYKRLRDGDEGPNTGGMGAYTPPSIPDWLHQRILDAVVHPTLAGMAEEGRPFTGVLYPGLMITPDGPKVLEYNGRFGDPETEVLIPLLETDLIEVIDACLAGDLGRMGISWRKEAACAVVMTSAGYPEAAAPAEPSGWHDLPNAVAFRGGASGRVLTVAATAPTLPEARRFVYDAVKRVALPGGHYRTDIAAVDRARAD